MAINVYQVNDLMSNMFFTNAVANAGSFASEFPLAPDNINNNLARYTQTMGVWASANYGADQTFGNPAWTQATGNSGNVWRAANSYYVRAVAYTNEANYWGYIGSLQGGYLHTPVNGSLAYTFDSVGSGVDYDGKLLGHGTNAAYPFPATQVTQFRDSNNTPADATCYITSTTSAYTRSQYVPPSYFTLYITSPTNNVSSGLVRFLFEQRPSTIAMTGTRTLASDAYGDIYTATQQRKLNRRRLSIMWARIFSAATTNIYTYPEEEDGTNVGYAGTGHMNGCYHYSSLSAITGSPTSRPSGDQRIRQHAMFPINEEYYGVVQETKCGILSNKTTTLPLIFFDLADTWSLKAGDITNVSITTNVVTFTCVNTFNVGDQVVVGGLTTNTFLNGVQLQVASSDGTHFTAAYTHADVVSVADTGTAVQLGARIAGVTTNIAKNKIYFLSERGDLAVYDFTVAGGSISALTAAPVLATGEAYSSLCASADGLTLYALNGTWSNDPTQTTTGTGRVGVTAYTIGSDTWGAANNSTLVGRINSRSLHEMIRLRNGWLAMLVEKGTATTTFTNSDATNIAWQLLVFDPSLSTWNTAQIDAAGALKYGGATGATYNKWTANTWNGQLLDVKTGKMLLQTHWFNNGLWSVDVSGTAAALDNTKLTAIGKGQASDIFPAGVTAGAKLQIRKSQSDDRTIFWHSEADKFNSAIFYLAPPSFTWTSGTLSTLAMNANSSGTTTTIDKDKLITDNSAWGANDEYSILGYFNESYVPLVVSGSTYSPNGEWGIGQLNIFSDHNLCSMVFIPTYYKAGNLLADSWADAAANPYSVPSTAGQNITLPYGLVVQFGPAGSNSYAQGDFHSFNVSYGSIKYQRKSRFTWSMFAGQTFQNTDSRALSALNAISPKLVFGNFTVAATGPTGITTGQNYYRSTAQWTQLNAGVPQNTPAVMTITTGNAPDLTTLVNIPGDGKVVTAGSQQGGQPASYAFDGNINHYWMSNGSGTQYIQIDLGANTTIQTYGLRFNALTNPNNPPASWTLVGSTTGAFAGEQVTVDSQSRPSPLYNQHAFACSSPGAYRYYRFQFASNGANNVEVGSIQLFTGALQSSINFSEILVGSNWSGGWERGLTFEVSTDGTNFTTITPLWRAHLGNLWCFARQTGIMKVRITVQSGTNQFISSNPTGYLLMGPYNFVDWGTQVQMDAARLGSITYANLTPPDPRAGSFETQAIGIASDAVSISIDGDSPISRSHYSPGSMINSFYDWVTVPALQYKVHPYWGFVILPGGGGNCQPSTQTGTTASITYNWGRRV